MQPTAWKQYSEIEKTSCNLFYLLFNKYMFIYNIVGVVPVFYCLCCLPNDAGYKEVTEVDEKQQISVCL